MSIQKFPGWRYHATAKPRLVQNEGEAHALPPGWYESPADVEQEVRPALTDSPIEAPVAAVIAEAAGEAPSTEPALIGRRPRPARKARE